VVKDDERVVRATPWGFELALKTKMLRTVASKFGPKSDNNFPIMPLVFLGRIETPVATVASFVLFSLREIGQPVERILGSRWRATGILEPSLYQRLLCGCGKTDRVTVLRRGCRERHGQTERFVVGRVSRIAGRRSLLFA